MYLKIVRSASLVENSDLNDGNKYSLISLSSYHVRLFYKRQFPPHPQMNIDFLNYAITICYNRTLTNQSFDIFSLETFKNLLSLQIIFIYNIHNLS